MQRRWRFYSDKKISMRTLSLQPIIQKTSTGTAPKRFSNWPVVAFRMRIYQLAAKSKSDDEEVSSVASARPQTVLKLCMRLADTYGVDPRDVYISRTETFFESNFENDETLLNAYAEALKTRTEEQKSSSFTDVLTRIAWPVVSSARRVDVLRSYLKIASYDDALLRLDMFEELVPSLDAFQIFQSDGDTRKSSAIEISRLFANEVASKAHPDFPNALASALAKAFANSSISSESIFASAVTTVLREAR